MKTLQVNGVTDLEEEDTQKDQYLTFSVGEYYGIEIRYITEIIGCRTLRRCLSCRTILKELSTFAAE